MVKNIARRISPADGAYLLEAAAMLAADKPAESGGEVVTFEQAWSKYEAKGFRYGKDALEQVRFGWKIAHEYTNPQAGKVGGEVVAWIDAENLPIPSGQSCLAYAGPGPANFNRIAVYTHPQSTAQ